MSNEKGVHSAASSESSICERKSPRLPDGAMVFDQLPDSALIRQPTLEVVLSISSSTVWRLARRGVLRPIKISERVTGWRVGDVRAYLARLHREAA